MTNSATATSNTISLKGSVDIVTEFFDYSVNSILYQRAIYPPETFSRSSKYGLMMMKTGDDELKSYIETIMSQLKDWLLGGRVRKLVLVIKGVDSKETLERWVFDCEATEETPGDGEKSPKKSSKRGDKSMKEIQGEIQAIMRQITASVTFLPLITEPCSFDLLIYADKDATVPMEWEDSDPCLITNSEVVQLRSFSTKVHKVDASVSYKLDEDI